MFACEREGLGTRLHNTYVPEALEFLSEVAVLSDTAGRGVVRLGRLRNELT